MGNLPIVIFVEESENLSKIFGLFFEELISDVKLSPFDFFIVVQIIGFK
jgi:hypothetical protein